MGEWWSCGTRLWGSGRGLLELWRGCFVAEAWEEDLSWRWLQVGGEVWEGIEGGLKGGIRTERVSGCGGLRREGGTKGETGEEREEYMQMRGEGE